MSLSIGSKEGADFGSLEELRDQLFDEACVRVPFGDDGGEFWRGDDPRGGDDITVVAKRFSVGRCSVRVFCSVPLLVVDMERS